MKMNENILKTILQEGEGYTIEFKRNFTQDDDYLQNAQKQEKVKEYERQIDQLVYKLYDLTDDEIKIVEKSVE
jgi:type II restriction/modification system DNA methylase subunit YeeA